MSPPESLVKILSDRGLASLGDAYVNFVFSLALSRSKGTPKGVKVSGRILAEASKISGLRDRLPRRTSRKDSANALESLIAYAYLNRVITLEESLDIIAGNINSPSEAFATLACRVLERMKVS